jgi:hypothetical protein
LRDHSTPKQNSRTLMPQQLAGWADIGVLLAVVGELRPAEGAVLPLRLVEGRDVGLDPALVDQSSRDEHMSHKASRHD